MIIESFTDGGLIELAKNGDHEAIVDVCELIARRMSDTFSERFRRGVTLVGSGMTPNDAFDWRDRSLRHLLKQEARATLEKLSANDVGNDADLYLFIQNVLCRLKAGIPPNSAFNWNQARPGRRNMHVNSLRNWDIGMTVHRLREEGYGFYIACEIVAEVVGLNDRRIQRIIKGMGNSEPPMPDEIFPLPRRLDGTFKLIRECDLLRVINENYKHLKNK